MKLDELAKSSGISIAALNNLAFNAPDSARFDVRYIRKRNGSYRTIIAPKSTLKRVLDVIHASYSIPVSTYAHGFNPGSSIVTNAMCHSGRLVVVNLDIENFFPSITYRKVKRLFSSLEDCADTLDVVCMLCTREIEGKRFLYQGSPVSPAISNGCCLELDNRLAGMASKFGFTFTRYADDLTFSGDNLPMSSAIVKLCTNIVRSHGFQVNAYKTKIMPYYQRQSVTGIVVNGG